MLQKTLLAIGVTALLAACNSASSKQEAISGVQGGTPGVNTQGGGGVGTSSCAPGVDCTTAYTQKDNMSPCTANTTSTPSLNGMWQLSRSYADGHTEITTLSISASKLSVYDTCVFDDDKVSAKNEDINILEQSGELTVTDKDSDSPKQITDDDGKVHTCHTHVPKATFSVAFAKSCLLLTNGPGKALEFVPTTSIPSAE